MPCSCVQLEVARAYYLEPLLPPCSSAGEAAQRHTGAAQLETVLLSHPPRRACGGNTVASEHGEVPCGEAGHCSSARSNLALRLAGACDDGQGAVEQGGAAPLSGTHPVPIGRHGKRAGVRFCSAVATELEVAATAARQPSDDEEPPGGRCFDEDEAFESEFGSQWYWGSPLHNAQPPAVANGAVEAAAAAAQGSSEASSVVRSTGSALERREELAGSEPSSPDAADSSAAGFASPASSPLVLQPSRGSAPPHRRPHAACMPRAASEVQLLSASQRRKQRRQAQQAQQAQPQAGSEEAGWTPAHAFTRGRDFHYRTVVLHWSDPRVPGALRPVIQASGCGVTERERGSREPFAPPCDCHPLSRPAWQTQRPSPAFLPYCQGNERLLKRYESGLPAWAIYLPQFGFFYRPWLRNLTWALFYAFSAFSFAMGFYDLLKAVPGLQVRVWCAGVVGGGGGGWVGGRRASRGGVWG